MAEICRFYARGSCSFGSACRQLHVSPAGAGNAPRAPAPAGGEQVQQLALEEERIDPYDDEPLTFRQLREKYFGQYSEAEFWKYWRETMKPTGKSRPALRAKEPAENRGGRTVCRFFIKGSCQFGESCRNLHVLDVEQLDADPDPIDPPVPEWLSQPREELKGSKLACWTRGEAGLDDESEESEWRPHEPAQSGSSSSSGPGRGGGYARRGAAETPEFAECGICFENIRQRGERFGMLENCDHAFCLSCIRAWRKQKEQQDRVNLRMCPLCRHESFFVVPCDRLVRDPDEKSSLIEAYKQQMSSIPCKAFDYGRGKCPFGNSCFYAHLNEDGTRHVPQKPRKMVGVDGTQIIGEVKLSDFFT